VIGGESKYVVVVAVPDETNTWVEVLVLAVTSTGVEEGADHGESGEPLTGASTTSTHTRRSGLPLATAPTLTVVDMKPTIGLPA